VFVLLIHSVNSTFITAVKELEGQLGLY